MSRGTVTTWVTIYGLVLIAATWWPAFAGTATVDFPQKGRSITIIVPNAPGGINDMTARLPKMK